MQIAGSFASASGAPTVHDLTDPDPNQMMRHRCEIFAVRQKKLKRLYFGLGVFGLASSTALGADALTIHRHIDYYDVSGTTLAEVQAAVAAGQPPESRGFVSITNYYLEYLFNFLPSQDSAGAANCTIINASVIIDVVVKMPRHTDVDSMQADVRAIWDRFFAALYRHEMQHVEDIIDIGGPLPDAMNAVTAPDCDTATQQAQAVAKATTDAVQSRADAYDAETNHGVNDGAILQ